MFNSLGLRLTLAETANLTGDLIYMWQNRDFKNTLWDFNYDRTGTLNQVGFFQTLAGKLGYLASRFHLGTGVNQWHQLHRQPVPPPLEGYLNLPWKILAYGYFEYARTACNNRDSFANTLRRDDYFQVVFQLRRPVTSWMNIIAGFSTSAILPISRITNTTGISTSFWRCSIINNHRHSLRERFEPCREIEKA